MRLIKPASLGRSVFAMLCWARASKPGRRGQTNKQAGEQGQCDTAERADGRRQQTDDKNKINKSDRRTGKKHKQADR